MNRSDRSRAPGATGLLIIGLMVPVALAGQASSDACGLAPANQYPVGTSCVNVAFNKPAAYVPNITLAPASCNSGNFDDAFGWFTATAATTTITFTPGGLFDDAVLHILSACAANASLACADNAVFGAETVTLATVPGTNYIIRVQRYNGNGGFNGQLCVWSPPPPPANDNCPGAIALPVLPTCTMLTFSNAGATASGTAPAPTCGPAPTTDVWFTFTTGASGQVFIDTQAGTLADGVMQLYSGACGALATVACNDDEDFFGGLFMPEIDRRCATLAPFTTYRIRFWGYGGATGTFGICVSAPATPTTPQEDCAGGATICNDQQISNNANFTGCTADLTTANNGCLDGNESQGTWYFFSPSASGTAALTIQPAANIDYDFAIWGPMSTITCPPVGNPVRCSWAFPPNVPGYPGAAAFVTGMGNGAVDASENEFGNGWVAPLNIVAGQIYIMYIDNFDVTGQAFTLDWTLTNGASLDCTVLPVELIGPEADVMTDGVHLSWATQTETGTARFVVERSVDDLDYAPIGEIPAAGHSLERLEYAFHDRTPDAGLNYYRLRVQNSDGTGGLSSTVSAIVGMEHARLLVRPNPATDRVHVLIPRSSTSRVHYTLRTADGAHVREGLVPWDTQRDRLEISLAGVDAGLYVLVLEDATGGSLGSARVVVDPHP